jgi:hypothetical protein
LEELSIHQCFESLKDREPEPSVEWLGFISRLMEENANLKKIGAEVIAFPQKNAPKLTVVSKGLCIRKPIDNARKVRFIPNKVSKFYKWNNS